METVNRPEQDLESGWASIGLDGGAYVVTSWATIDLEPVKR